VFTYIVCVFTYIVCVYCLHVLYVSRVLFARATLDTVFECLENMQMCVLPEWDVTKFEYVHVYGRKFVLSAWK